MSISSALRGVSLSQLNRAVALLSINTAVRGLGALAALVLAYGAGAGADMDRYMAFTLLTVAFASLTAAALPALSSRLLSGGALAESGSVQACRAWARRLAHLGAASYLLVLPVCAWTFDSTAEHAGLLQLGLLLLIGAPGLLLAPRVAVEQALLQSRGRPYAAGACSAFSTGTALAFTFIAVWQSGVLWAAVGLLLGAWLEYATLRRLNKAFDQQLVKDANDQTIPFPWKAFAVFTAASTGIFFSGIYDQLLLARLGTGSQALWGLAGRAASFITMSLFAVAGILSTLLVVRSSGVGGAHALTRDALRLAGGMFVASLLGMGLLVVGAYPLTALLYERGAFTAADTARVAHVLQFGVWAYVLYPTTAVLVRAASAQARHRALLVSAAAFIAVKLCLGWWAHHRYGIPGIAVATGVAMLAQTGVLLTALWRITA